MARLRIHPKHRRKVLAGSVVTVLATLAPTGVAVAGEPSTVIVVQPNEVKHPVSPLLNGVNHRWDKVGNGMWDAERDEPVPAVVEAGRQMGLNLVRYPGGTVANLFDWKKAIGPQAERGCQLNGRPNDGKPIESTYGVDEHQRYVEAIGAQTQIVIPFAHETAAGAADWVEYMNAPVGTNPNGGTAWAEVRAANGHPEPYEVKYWEIGNEHYLPGGQRYWLPFGEENEAAAMRLYALGGTQRQENQRVGKGCDFRPNLTGNGAPSQVFNLWYPPAVPDSQTVYVDGAAWVEVADLATAGPSDQVYEFDPANGEIRFGDGVHGAIPAKGQRVSADYDSGPHPGYLDFATAMKAVDPSIDVCSVWGTQDFPRFMAEQGHGDDYDCLSVHPYTTFQKDFGGVEWASARQGFDQHMLGEAAQWQRVADLMKEVRKHGRADAYVPITELGALYFGPGGWSDEVFPNWVTSQTHVVYMASQFARFAEAGTPWVEGNALIDVNGTRTLVGAAPDYLYTSEAVLREAMTPFVEGGGNIVEHEVQNNPDVRAAIDKGSYQALVVTTARRADGGLDLFAVNRNPTESVDTQVVTGLTGSGTATVTEINGDDFTSYNSAEQPDAIRTTQYAVEVSGGNFRYDFPAHSISIIRIDAGLS